MKVSKNRVLWAAIFVVLTNASYAATGGMPWEGPLNKIKASIQGPVAQGIAVITIVVGGLSWAFTDGGSMQGKAVKIVAGLAIALGGAALVTKLFGGSAGALLFM